MRASGRSSGRVCVGGKRKEGCASHGRMWGKGRMRLQGNRYLAPTACGELNRSRELVNKAKAQRGRQKNLTILKNMSGNGGYRGTWTWDIQHEPTSRCIARTCTHRDASTLSVSLSRRLRRDNWKARGRRGGGGVGRGQNMGTPTEQGTAAMPRIGAWAAGFKDQ